MPLYKTINVSETTRVFVWKITESFEALQSEVQLNASNGIRLKGMKSQLHQRAFLSVRKLLQHSGYDDFDLYYDEFGKPHLNDGKHISITHSHEFSAIVLSDENIGIDMEMKRDMIVRIADKFVGGEADFLIEDDKDDYISKLTAIWGAKESIFKILNEKGISFKDHIKINPFEMGEKKVAAWLDFEQMKKCYSVCFEEIECFVLVYAVEKN